MASNYWTPDRQRLSRLQAAFVRMNDIVRDLFDIKFSAKLGYSYPSLADHWQQWCSKNAKFVQRYPFWKKVAKTKHQKKEIPVLDAVDVSYFCYLMAKIDPHCSAMKDFREIRNLIAHMTETELGEAEFHGQMLMGSKAKFNAK